MKVVLKDFQEDAVAELKSKFGLMRELVAKELSAVLLNAPTGSGKTLMATALIETLLAGDEATGDGGDPDVTFLWLTDQPELNLQTYDKMLATATVLTEDHLVVVDAGLDAETLEPGKVYFLNTQKLGAGATTFNATGDNRTFPLWETLANTVAQYPERFVLVLDEAHRGARGAEAKEADTIMQRFMKGNGVLPPVPLVVGISATPKRFVDLCNATGRVLRTVDVDPGDVRRSGLLKEYVDLFHPDESQPGDVTMLEAGIRSWLEYCQGWGAYQVSEGEDPVRPVLLVQVADAKKGGSAYSETDLGMVLSTLQKLVPHEAGDLRWLAHAFQDEGDLIVANQAIRRLSPSVIERDPDVRIVLFKTSLNTGWDCPRAETMVSFRPAKEEDNIAQLVGRMVRTPLARLVEENEHLNTVALYLPYYDQAAVKRVIARLSSDPESIPPTEGREGKDAVTLYRNPKLKACFPRLEELTTYTVPRVRSMKPVPRVAKLAALLADVGWEVAPVRSYRSALVGVLTEELATHRETDDFNRLVDEASVLDVRRYRHDYAAAPPSEGRAEVEDTDEDGATDREERVDDEEKGHERIRVMIADQNVEDLYDRAGRLLGEGLHKEYLRTRLRARKAKVPSARHAKLELHALVTTPGVLEHVYSTADEIRVDWVNTYKAKLGKLDEKRRQVWRDIEGAGSAPEPVALFVPSAIEALRGKTSWPKHLFVDEDGEYHEDFGSTWETRVVTWETKHSEIIGWLRNRDRKPWSICVARQDGTRWAGVYPDFVFFRKTKGGIICDLVDPHLLNDKDAPARAAAIAKYADNHKDDFGRIELVIFENANDEEGKRLDLLDEKLRAEVAKVTSHAHLEALFAKS